MTSYPVPSGKTARRLEWPFLPPNLRAYIERKCGSPVVEAESQGAGFTPGFASVLTCEDGSRHFVKAASVKAQRLFADSYREEARKLRRCPTASRRPAPVAARRRLGRARARVRRRPQPATPLADRRPRRLSGRPGAGRRPDAAAGRTGAGHVRRRVRRARRLLGPRPGHAARPPPPRGRGGAGGRLRGGHRGRHASCTPTCATTTS